MKQIREIVESIPIADTHEHLLEEEDRIKASDKAPLNDIGVFFTQYVDSDLVVAGMPPKDLEKVNDPQITSQTKWKLIKPWWEAMRNTAYGMMVRESIRILFDEEDINDGNREKIDEALRKLAKPGYYEQILKQTCNIDHCQVNALDVPFFRETKSPDLLLMDLCTSFLSSDFDRQKVGEFFGRDITCLDDALEAIDKAFSVFGPKAIAVKNQSAYRRRIDYKIRSRKEAEENFKLYLENEKNISREQRKPFEDFLFHYTTDKAVEYHLPVKMHTGFHAGRGVMPLHNVRLNPGDMCELCRAQPEAKFVFMHITYPYQDEAIAVAKHYPNAYIDMCWSWMISPLAAVRFLKECLLSVPANKIFTFGGDVSLVELVPGHIHIARKGICQAITELAGEGWLKRSDIPGILERLLRSNAYELFPVEQRIREGKSEKGK